ncbi:MULTISPECIES: hypothetical protein [Moorena]|nr:MULTISPECIES: hypothetical protein [Moorena]NEP48892.1 hypothetical protein [Moorena sp. SIO3C2]NEQ13719.1 hypothetical protein [Moorena sp. SIO3E2]NEP34095.1 hypothetical protein [Moorena sp. SIO3B2]NEP69738.1 hypothetical protein [Moorena sp. SIO3A5]NER91850.1 hypothetical protein [Moorena sp. SIO3A2]
MPGTGILVEQASCLFPDPLLPVPRSAVPYSLFPTPYSLLPTPYSLCY